MFKYLFKELDKDWHKNAFIFGLYFSYVLYFFALTGIIVGAPKYLTILHTILIYYISFFLIMKFGERFKIPKNPFLIMKFNPYVRYSGNYKRENHKFERKIAYYSGVFLLLTTSFTAYFQNEFKAQIYKLGIL